MITAKNIITLFPKLSLNDGQVIVDAILNNNINTVSRIGMFLANCAHESAGFTRLEEGLNYSAEGLARTWPKRYSIGDGKTPNSTAISIARNPQKIANLTYANRMGNGDVESGDGWNYRGRGPIQITFKDNYIALDKVHPELNVLKSPDVISKTINGAIKSAIWYWNANNCNTKADINDFDGACDLVNLGRKTQAIGDSIGYKDRLDWYKKILKLIGD